MGFAEFGLDFTRSIHVISTVRMMTGVGTILKQPTDFLDIHFVQEYKGQRWKGIYKYYAGKKDMQ